MFAQARPPAPPPELRARVLAAAVAAGHEVPTLVAAVWSWLRPQLGWIAAVLVLLAAHLALDLVWQPARRHQTQAAAPPPGSEATELTAQGVPLELAERFAAERSGSPSIGDLVREVM